MGKDSCARTEVVKEIWRHAKENNLQVRVTLNPKPYTLNPKPLEVSDERIKFNSYIE